jgi:hypothetical protein
MTVEQASARRTYLIGKGRPSAIVGRNREPGELAVIVVSCGLGLLAGLVIPWLPLRALVLGGLPALGFAVVLLPYRGRSVYRWFEIDRTYRRLARTAAARWSSGASVAGTRLDGREGDIAPPPGVGRIRWLVAPFGADHLAVLSHLDRRTLTAAVEIEGPGVGSRDGEDQEALAERFGSLLLHVANSDGFVRRLQMIARTVPADPDAHAHDVAARGNPNTPGWLVRSYDELQQLVTTSSEQHRNYLVGAMHYTRALAAEVHALGGGDDALATILAREMADIAARLGDAGIRVVQPLGVARLASLIHSMYDPEHPIDETAAMTRRNAWPAELDATAPTYLAAKTRESDTAAPWYHATAWVKEWPLTPVGVNFLAPLLVHTPDVIRTVAVAMDLEPTDVAIERMLTEKTNDDAEGARAAKLGRIGDPRDRTHSERLDQRGDDLAGGAGGVNLVGYLTVSARTPDRLAKDKRTIRAAAGKSYLKLEWCDREHHRAFTNTLPFATGLRT